MEVLIEAIENKLRQLPVDKLQVVLDFVNFLEWQEFKGSNEVESAISVQPSERVPEKKELL